MIYVVIEMQTMQDGTMGFINTQYTDKEQAESAYCTARAAAAISQLPKHTIMWVTNEGFVLEEKCYIRGEEQ